jgi:putative aldouronate transport system permease protein
MSAMGSSAAASMTLPSTTVRMAIAVIGVIPVLALYPFFQSYFVKGIALGGVKE